HTHPVQAHATTTSVSHHHQTHHVRPGRVHHFIGHIPRRFGLAPFFSVVEAHSCSLFSAEVRSHREGGRRCRWFRGRVAPGGHGRTPSATGRTTIWAYLFFCAQYI